MSDASSTIPEAPPEGDDANAELRELARAPRPAGVEEPPIAPGVLGRNGGRGDGRLPTAAAAPDGEWRPPAGTPVGRSSYMQYLPGLFEGDDFLGRFLLVFETILGPIERTVANIPYVFDAHLVPREMLPWLGGWLGLALDERWPEERRRELLASAARLYAWRGTRRGLGEFIRLYTGVTPEILEPTPTEVSANRDLAFRFTVRIRLPAGADIDREILERIIDAEKPAFAAASLELLEA
jgi:phage tail-like protein